MKRVQDQATYEKGVRHETHPRVKSLMDSERIGGEIGITAIQRTAQVLKMLQILDALTARCNTPTNDKVDYAKQVQWLVEGCLACYTEPVMRLYYCGNFCGNNSRLLSTYARVFRSALSHGGVRGTVRVCP